MEGIARSTQALIYVGYFAFVRSLFDFKTKDPLLNKICVCSESFSYFSFFFLFFTHLFLSTAIFQFSFTIFRVVLAVVSLTAIIMALKHNDRLLN
ncbi:MAG: hypothetical protein RLZZ546_2193 [Bacteroidota bacterium]|jgi:hypothetical protein